MTKSAFFLRVHAHRERWQVGMLLREVKSYASLRGFDTANPSIAEGLIWAAIGAALLKRVLAHGAQRRCGAEISSALKEAVHVHHVPRDIATALVRGGAGLERSLEEAQPGLAACATRAYPIRVRVEVWP